MAKIFDGGDEKAHSINKLMRMQFSNHWKTAIPKQCKLWKVDKDWGDEYTANEKYTFTEVTKP